MVRYSTDVNPASDRSLIKVPAEAVTPQRHLEAARPGESLPSHYPDCFGCGAEHPAGLHMRVVAGEGLTVSGEFEVSPLHQGAPGLAHGGLLAAAFDEVLGALNWLTRVPAVTAKLETDFLAPVAVGSTIHIDAELCGQVRRKIYTHAVGRVGDAEGPVVLTASALFIQVGIEHFTTHGRAEEVVATAERRRANQDDPSRYWQVNP